MEQDITKEGNTTKAMGKVIQIDDRVIHDHLGRMVRDTVEETLNAMLDAEAEALVGASRYERSEGRRDYRSGHYKRKLHTRSGEVTLRVPKLRVQALEAAAIGRYRRRCVEEALIEMFLAGVSTRRVADITEAFWSIRTSRSTISDLVTKKVYKQIEAWRNAPITGSHSYLSLDGIVMKRSWGGEVSNVSLLVATGQDGYREVLGIREGCKEDKESWRGFLRHLKQRGLKGVQLITLCRSGRSGCGTRSEGSVATMHGSLVPQRLVACSENG